MSEFKYFTREEFDCQETGENRIPGAFIYRLDTLRERCGFPFVIRSGYRSPLHSAEVDKENGPGEHTRAAVDVEATTGYRKYTILKEAMKMGFTGIGVGPDFVHLDDRVTGEVLWTY